MNPQVVATFNNDHTIRTEPCNKGDKTPKWAETFTIDLPASRQNLEKMACTIDIVDFESD
jgi:hypothetical protein